MFFIVEFKIYRDSKPEKRRLFRPNLPEVKATERWVHCKVPHRDPESLVRARPDVLHAAGLRLPTRGGEWIFDGELSVWIYRGTSEPESRVSEWPMHLWSPGHYQGESAQTYRLAAAEASRG